MDRSMYSYTHHYNPAEMQDASVASSSYDPRTYLQNQSPPMSFPGVNHSSFVPEVQQDPQSSYAVSDPLSTSHHPYMEPCSPTCSSRGTFRNGSPNSPHSPDLPLPHLPRTRRSPASRHLPLPDDIDDDSDDEPLPPNASERERSEWKKRRNTKAARRSRKRKMIYTERLENSVEKLRLEKEMWRTRALTLRQLLKSHNLPCPDFED